MHFQWFFRDILGECRKRLEGIGLPLRQEFLKEIFFLTLGFLALLGYQEIAEKAEIKKKKSFELEVSYGALQSRQEKENYIKAFVEKYQPFYDDLLERGVLQNLTGEEGKIFLSHLGKLIPVQFLEVQWGAAKPVTGLSFLTQCQQLNLLLGAETDGEIYKFLKGILDHFPGVVHVRHLRVQESTASPLPREGEESKKYPFKGEVHLDIWTGNSSAPSHQGGRPALEEILKTGVPFPSLFSKGGEEGKRGPSAPLSFSVKSGGEGEKNLVLTGILHHTEKKWVIWFNGYKITPQTSVLGIRIHKVTPKNVNFSYGQGEEEAILTLSLGEALSLKNPSPGEETPFPKPIK
jgi:hypothetical protein